MSLIAANVIAIVTHGVLISGDYPDVGNVVVGDTTNGSAGTFAPAVANTVKKGTQYGENGTEFTGTYIGVGPGRGFNRGTA